MAENYRDVCSMCEENVKNLKKMWTDYLIVSCGLLKIPAENQNLDENLLLIFLNNYTRNDFNTSKFF